MNEATLNRREMCRRLAAGSAAVALGTGPLAAAEDDAPFRFRYVLASSMYGKLKLAEIVPEVRKTGAAEIDVWPEHHANQREQIEAMGHDAFAELLRKHDVTVGMFTRYDLGPFGLQDEMRVLGRFGGSLLISGSSGPKGLSGGELKRAMATFVEQMKPHAAAAEEAGVTIGIENHANALLCSPDSLRHFAELAESPRLGAALAPYHLPQEPTLLARLIEDLGPKLVHFYAWQHGKGCMEKLPKEQELEQMPGRGTLDFRPLLAALKKIDYRGRTEIFMHPVPRGIPIMPTLAEVTGEINRARKYLEACARQA
ncbi:MAG: sugar phosphate isomerase/epimerase family protein [Planctomycetota bacterium]|jgi:sugar phosphate isomerase/epimerase